MPQLITFHFSVKLLLAYQINNVVLKLFHNTCLKIDHRKCDLNLTFLYSVTRLVFPLFFQLQLADFKFLINLNQ